MVRAWRPDATGFTIDYDVQEIHGTRYGTPSDNDRLSIDERSHHRAAGPPTKYELPLGLQWPAPAGR